MYRFAPEIPTTAELQGEFPLDLLAEMAIMERRRNTSHVLRNPREGTVGIVGPCAPDIDGLDQIAAEGKELVAIEASETEPGLVLIEREPIWKPRSRPDRDWSGLETSHHREAMAMIAGNANTTANAAIEYGHQGHPERYGQYLVMAWTGARTTDAKAKVAMAMHDPTLPIGIKNDLDGTLDSALEVVDEINRRRGSKAAPAVLMYRGGANAKTPEAWAEQYARAYELTEGRLVVDVAHGGEMAHDPNGGYQKSVAGQEACLEHVLELAEDGVHPAAIIAEASGTHSQVDPVMPHHVATNGILRLHQLKIDLVRV